MLSPHGCETIQHDGSAVKTPQLLDKLALASDIEVVVAGLPE
jgi:hypothetical protein